MGQVDPTTLVYPLSGSQKMAIRRNIEKMIGSVIGPRVLTNHPFGLKRRMLIVIEFL